MTGPGLACTLWPSTPASCPSRVRWSGEAGGAASGATAGSLDVSGPPLLTSIVFGHARPLSDSVVVALGGSFTTSGGGTAASMAANAAGGAEIAVEAGD